MGRPEVTQFVEESDCLLMLGALIHDVDIGIFTHNLDDRPHDLRHQRGACGSATTTTTTCCSTTSSASWARRS